jgi:hypothetical protein
VGRGNWQVGWRYRVRGRGGERGDGKMGWKMRRGGAGGMKDVVEVMR